jgi:hypothetical protein
MIDFELDEIVQMDGKGPVSLRTALVHIPSRVGPLGVYGAKREISRRSSMLNKSKR